MNIRIAILGAALWVAFGNGPMAAQDLLQEPRPGEALLGPLPFPQNVQGVPLQLRISLFFSRHDQAGKPSIHTRVLLDLADVQGRINDLVDTIPLPKDNCAHFGADNLVVSIPDKALSVSGNEATLQLKGEVDVWGCLELPFGLPPAKTEIQQPAEVALPLSLGLAGQKVGVTLGVPRVKLLGPLQPVTATVLNFFNVDLNARLKEAIDRAINPDLLKWSLPAALLKANPTLTRAEFLSNSGALVASLEMEASPDEALNQFLQGLQGASSTSANGVPQR
jgi:hypothetical protein